MPNKIVVVCGPTASGKTALGVELALLAGGEVVSADSMQIYCGMDIGTAKPTPAEMRGVPHHMLDVADPAEDYSVARYVADASACVEDILARGRLPILVGGTGLYIDHLVAGREFAPFSGHWREKLQARAAAQGVAPLYDQLRRVDPQRAEKLHPNDERRILRALEVWYETGETITAHDLRTAALPPRYAAVRIGLSFARRADLWERIDRRVDQMAADGLTEEVRGLLASGVPRSCTAMQAIGYKELAAALDAGAPVDGALEEIKLRSRQYAKRQLTWFRRNPAVKWLLWEKTPDLSRARRDATAYLEENGLL
ncbi:MAG: tRNA (adenosine(37)-N6)-dimethylallyltransferase MiaA [Clostridiales bacterium]|nr:tRNA (adenosine(37)-N6)-dimethylallyltransferase MiaA [Clostridiales bacterium]BDE85965.1 tRNA dimethylallyltransferase [Oscillospiraceae bacterium]CUQ56565.1 tRNA dimethylallyltransferase MiaA [Flavonifractor plautii]SCJ26935.1 tRNA dimethylallyltransferase [uncultured Flavonifractor sp.]